MKIVSSMVVLFVLLGCKEQNTEPDTNGEPDAGPDAGELLLKAPIIVSVDCAVSRNMTPFNIAWHDFDMVQTDDGAYLLRSEMPEKLDLTGRLVWSNLSMDGTLGTSFTAQEEKEGEKRIFVNALAKDDDGFVIMWLEGANVVDTENSLNLLRVDSGGNIVGTTETLVTTTNELEGLTVIRTETGHAVLWIDRDYTEQKLMFAILGKDNSWQVSPKIVIDEAQLGEIYWLYLEDAVRFDDGFAITFSTEILESSSSKYFIIVDDTGSPVGEASRLEGEPLFSSNIAVRDDGFLLAWTEYVMVEGDMLNGYDEAKIIIHIARYTREGALASPVYTLKDPGNFRECISPTWVDMGDDIGLIWSEGEFITICAGCFPDNVLHFVVLDSESLLPKSKVVTLSNDTSEFGLVSPMAVRRGDELLIVADIQHHTWAEGAAGAVTCEPSDQ